MVTMKSETDLVQRNDFSVATKPVRMQVLW